jgi:hypothetical protein
MKKSIVYAIYSLFILSGIMACRERDDILAGASTLEEVSIYDIQESSVNLASAIAKSANSPIIEHGFTYSKTNENPEVDDTSDKRGAIDPITPTPISFTGTLNGLETNTEYFVRAFASTANGTSYSPTSKFKTSDIKQPQVLTVTAENISFSSAILKGSITAKGTYPITEYGLVWGNNVNPTVDLETKSSTKNDINNFPSSFTVTAGGLSANTTYNFRAYVVSNGITSYGANMSFKTSDILQPGVQTGNSADITVNSAKLEGVITSKGTHSISERGVVWSTEANPTTDNPKAYIAGDINDFPNSYALIAGGLQLNTIYHYRAYVIMNGTTSYGENKTFKTSDILAPGIRTDDGPKVGENVATVWGTLTSKGSHPITEYGICWNTSANPTTSNSKKSYTGDVGGFPRQFDAFIENLRPATTYHYRAFVIMNGITTYGENKSFTTGVSEPNVSTGDVFNISGRGTVLTGTVSSQGSYPITEIGIVYGPNNNPTTANTKLSKSGSGVTFPHNYEFVERGGFSGSGAVYFRAYVISNGKTYYGESKLARASPPSLTAGNSTLSGSTYTLRGTISTAGTLGIKEYGIVWSSSVNTPTVSHNKLAINSAPAGYPVNITGTLAHGTIGSCKSVSFRSYAITTDGTVYYSSNVGGFRTGGCVN